MLFTVKKPAAVLQQRGMTLASKFNLMICKFVKRKKLKQAGEGGDLDGKAAAAQGVKIRLQQTLMNRLSE